MLVKAMTTFAADICMAEGEVRDIPEGRLLSGLLSCDYVKPVKTAKNKEKNDEAERGND